jgi:hypothetical protein
MINTKMRLINRRALAFTPISDDEYTNSSDLCDVIGLWDGLSDTLKTAWLYDKLNAIAGKDIMNILSKVGKRP